MIGSSVTGYCSQFFGRRLSIIGTCVLGGALIYPYGFTSGPGLYAVAFFEQFCAQGVWGIVPIHLIELSPAAFRTFVVGTSYQLGVLIASPCNTIIETIGLRYPLPSAGSETQHYDYRVPICALTGCMYAYIIVVTAIGPEKRGEKLAEEDNDDSDIDLPESRTNRSRHRVSHHRF
jgi:SHS family lactate transporter-like MFS transporter